MGSEGGPLPLETVCSRQKCFYVTALMLNSAFHSTALPFRGLEERPLICFPGSSFISFISSVCIVGSRYQETQFKEMKGKELFYLLNSSIMQRSYFFLFVLEWNVRVRPQRRSGFQRPFVQQMALEANQTSTLASLLGVNRTENLFFTPRLETKLNSPPCSEIRLVAFL